MKAAKHETSDRRVTRTRDALREALIGLILDRSWDEISVQDICDRANIGRSTFYMHYSCKEKLLSGAFSDLRKGLRAQERNSSTPSSPIFGVAGGLIAHAHEYRQLFRAVIGKRSSLMVQQRFRQTILSLVEEDIGASDIPPHRRAAATHYIAGALFELLTWWIDSRSPLAPPELEALFREMTEPVLAVLSGKA